MKVKNDYIFRQVADEYLLIPVGEAALHVKGLIGLSESGYQLYRKLQNDCTRDELVAALLAEYVVSVEEATADVDAFLNQMRQLGMLVED